MGRYLNVPLMSLGTVDVEAFSSYLVRFSSTHCVSIARLLSRLASEYPPKVNNILSGSFVMGLPTLVRPNETTQAAVDLLSQATGIDPHLLASTTFLSLSEALDRSSGAYSKTFRWCPECMADMRRSGVPGYFKLQWHLEAVTHCHLHRLPLQSLCPHCDASQGTSRIREDSSMCSVCGGALGVAKLNTAFSHGWKSPGADLIDLVSHVASNPGYVFPKNSVRKSVGQLFDAAWKTKDGPRIWSMIPRDEALAYTELDHPITLLEARRIAFRWNLPLVNLLDGQVSTSTGTVDPEWNAQLPSDLAPKPRKPRLNRNLLAQNLQKTVEKLDTGQSPSLKAVATNLNISTGALWHHFPKESRRIVINYEKAKSNFKKDQEAKAQKAVRTYTKMVGSRQRPFSRKKALMTLWLQTKLPRQLLWREIFRAAMARQAKNENAQ